MTGCFSFILLVLECMFFTMICAFNLIPLATGMTGWNGHKTKGFYRLVRFVIRNPPF